MFSRSTDPKILSSLVTHCPTTLFVVFICVDPHSTQSVPEWYLVYWLFDYFLIIWSFFDYLWIPKTPVARCPLRVASWHKNARCWQKNTRWCPKNARWHNNACCSENMLTWFHPLPTQKHPLNCALSMECKNALRKIFTYLVLGRDEIRGWHPRNYTKMSSHILNTITLIRADYRL